LTTAPINTISSNDCRLNHHHPLTANILGTGTDVQQCAMS